MSYIVMECHTAYAIVMDEKGNFLQVANFNYKEGEKVDDVIILNQSSISFMEKRRTRFFNAFKVASFGILAFGVIYYLMFSSYGTINIQINPEVEFEVNRFDYVISARGMNEDGQKILAGWNCTFQKVDKVTKDFLKKVVEQGYLKQGGIVTYNACSRNSDWERQLEGELRTIIENEEIIEIHVIPNWVGDEEISEDWEMNLEEKGKSDDWDKVNNILDVEDEDDENEDGDDDNEDDNEDDDNEDDEDDDEEDDDEEDEDEDEE